MLTITDADSYILAYCIDVDDWKDSDDERKTRLMNVAADVLMRRYSQFIIPDNAVYDFANVLAIKFNDTNKLAQNGVASFSLSGVANFGFANTGGDVVNLNKMIPQKALDLIGDANGVKLSVRRIGQGVY